jgi:acyl-CoA thioester hydrolase
MRFHQPLYYDEIMFIHTRPSEMERVRLRFDYIVTRENNDIVCEGFTRHCATNRKGVPVAIDEKTIHLWEIFPQ